MENLLQKTLLCLGFTVLSVLAFGQGNNILGQVKYNYSTPMHDVNVFLADSTGNVIETTTTNSAGHYHFSNLADGSYTVTFSTSLTAGGITLSDGFLVLLHLLGFYPMTPFQKTLADVNNSGTVTWSDYNEILFSYLNQGNPFSGGAWDFETYSVTLPIGNRAGFVTAGGSNGDVNGTFQPPKYGNCILSSSEAEAVTADLAGESNLNLLSSGTYEIAGMHLVFYIPEGVALQSAKTWLPGAHISQVGNELRVTWMSDGKCNLTIDPSQSIVEFTVSALDHAVADQLYLLTLGNESHFIDNTGEMLPFVNLSLPGLIFKTSDDLLLKETIYPNPFMACTTLEYTLPSEGNVKIMVTNQAGQVINLVTNELQEAGSHSVKIDGSQWPAGIYHYGIFFTGNTTAMKAGSMIKSK